MVDLVSVDISADLLQGKVNWSFGLWLSKE